MEPFEQVILSFISSNISIERVPTDILLNDNSPWFMQTELKVSSVLKLNKVVTVEKKIIKSKLGMLPDEVLVEVDKKLKELFKIK